MNRLRQVNVPIQVQASLVVLSAQDEEVCPRRGEEFVMLAMPKDACVCVHVCYSALFSAWVLAGRHDDVTFVGGCQRNGSM
jgi:hypothetical protein